MGTTTFSGPLRSQDSVRLVSKNTTTGLIQDRTFSAGVRDARRYYLEEWFKHLPKLNAVNTIDPDADDASALALYTLANKDFEVLGTKTGNFIDMRDQGIWEITQDKLSSFDTHLWPTTNGKITGDLKDELLHFSEAIKNKSNFLQEPEFAAKSIKIIDCIFESIETGNKVSII